jgi:hypothetical protein
MIPKIESTCRTPEQVLAILLTGTALQVEGNRDIIGAARFLLGRKLHGC